MKLLTVSTIAAAALLLSGCFQQISRLGEPFDPPPDTIDNATGVEGPGDDLPLIDREVVVAEPSDELLRRHATSPLEAVDGETVATSAEPVVALARAEESVEPVAPPVTDVWQRIQSGLSLPVSNHPRTIAERNWYARHPKYLARTAERARPFLFHIVNEVEKRGFPLEIALLPIVESAFQPFAYSHGRAAGLWQFIPATGKRYGLRQNWWYDGRRDVVESTRAALDYLDYLQKEFDGDWLLALAAYNSGEGKVAREIRKNRQKGKKSDYWNLSLPRETRAYVPKLLALRDIVGQPDKFSLKLPEIANRPHFKVVEVGSQIDLALAAELAGLTVEELYRYNPGFNRWATPPSGPHRLVLPQQNSATFRAALADYPAERRISWSRHTIRRGETLSTIAMRYGTSVENLRRSNHLRSGSLIRAGDHLIIPSAMADASRYTLSADQRAIATATAGGAGKGASRRHHTVVSGDTLWSISRRYGVALASLARWNSLATRDTLRVGRELVIWSSKGTARTPPGPVAAIADKARKTLHYTVRSGDSLYGIARRYKVSVSDLQRWNKGVTNPARLSIGQRLTLHVDVTSL